MSALSTVLAAFPVRAKEIIDCEATNQVIVWADCEAKWRDEVLEGESNLEEWVYKGESMFILDFEETAGGEGGILRMKRVVEFLDSQAASHATGLVKRASEKLASKEAAGQ